jgi:hypothetical protein
MTQWVTNIESTVISLIIGTVLIHLGAKVASIKNATLLKAFEVAIVGAVVGLILTILFGLVSSTLSISIGAFVFLVVAFIVLVAVIKAIYNTTWLKALVTWIVYIVILMAVGIVISTLTHIPVASIVG